MTKSSRETRGAGTGRAHGRALWRYERRGERLLPRRLFLWRQVAHVGLAALLLGASLGIGMIGYRWTEGMSWLDAFLNASMILSGMGPVKTDFTTDAGKLFAGTYALFAGVAFLGVVGVIIAPLAHRALHRLHLEAETGEN